MATSRCVSPNLENADLLLDNNFELFVKSRLNWSKEKWEEEGESAVKLRKLCNSMRFWNKKLDKAFSEKNIIVTLYNQKCNAMVSLTDFVDAIMMLDKTIKIKGYTSFRNPRYISISFESVEVKNFVQNNFKKVGEHNVVYLHWAGRELVHSIKVHWYPDELDVIHVKNELGKYFDILELSREETALMNGVKFPSGIVNCKGIIKKGINVESVPHLAGIADLECLVTIYGRNFLCLTCDKVGHRARDCPTPFCGKCRKLIEKSHKCEDSVCKPLSYAQKVRGGEDVQEGWEAKYDDDSGVLIDSSKTFDKGSESIHFGVLKNEGTENGLRKRKQMWGGFSVCQDSMNCFDSDGDNTEQTDDSIAEDGYTREINKMENHLRELQSLGLKVGESVKDFAKNEITDEEKDAEFVKMETDNISMKRKCELNFGLATEECNKSGLRKTYARRGSRNSKTNKK